MGSEKHKNINTRFEGELAGSLEQFCDRTHRNRNDVIRAAVKMLLDGGHKVADRRLSSGVWEEELGPAALAEAQREMIISSVEAGPLEIRVLGEGKKTVELSPAMAKAIQEAVRAAIDAPNLGK